MNAWELYGGGNMNDSVQTEEDRGVKKLKINLNDSQGSILTSKTQTSDFKRMRIESFAKTPSFIKSPGSLASSAHYTKGSIEPYQGDTEYKLNESHTKLIIKEQP